MTKDILDDNDDKALLQGLLNKVLLYRFTRNLDKELEDRRITHREFSGSTGRDPSAFNRSFNKLENMRISTFAKSLSAINKIVSQNSKLKLVAVQDVLNEEIFRFASMSIDLAVNTIDHLLKNDPEFCKNLVDMKFYVVSLEALKNILSNEESEAYERILNRISSEGGN